MRCDRKWNFGAAQRRWRITLTLIAPYALQGRNSAERIPPSKRGIGGLRLRLNPPYELREIEQRTRGRNRIEGNAPP
jgi:hypothetical protein